MHTERASFESARRLMAYQASLGCEQQALDATRDGSARARARIDGAADRGAIYTPSEDAGDCCKFCNELKRLMTTGPNPVTYRFDVEVERAARDGRAR